MTYLVTYMRIQEDKTGMRFEGPFMGGLCDTETEADMTCRELASKAMRQGAIIPKIYELTEEFTLAGAMESAQQQFDRVKERVTETKEMMGRPKKKRRKKNS